jgi:hypothetical protein
MAGNPGLKSHRIITFPERKRHFASEESEYETNSIS